MKIRVVASDVDGLTGIISCLLGKLLKAIENLLDYQVALLNPAFCAAGGSHASEAPVTLQNVHTVAIFDGSGLGVNRSHMVPQKGLRSRHIGYFKNPASPPVAGGKQQE
jgi:hypothetical protein